MKYTMSLLLVLLQFSYSFFNYSLLVNQIFSTKVNYWYFVCRMGSDEKILLYLENMFHDNAKDTENITYDEFKSVIFNKQVKIAICIIIRNNFDTIFCFDKT